MAKMEFFRSKVGALAKCPLDTPLLILELYFYILTNYNNSKPEIAPNLSTSFTR